MKDRIQVLVAAMHQTDDSLVQRMGITTDAVIGNQCNICSNQLYEYGDHRVEYLNRPERGVGLNRNTALLRSKGDILTFADEDMTFMERYDEVIRCAFQELPDADAIIFNVKIINSDRKSRQHDRIKRLHFFNALNYGAPRISVRANALKRENILFHTCFGGGTRYNAGEDTLFVVDMLRRGLRLYAYPVCIAVIDQGKSTWFTGYDKKYLHDKGAIYAAVSRRWAKLLCLQDLLRHPRIYRESQMSFWNAYRIMNRGIRSFETLESYCE